MPKRAAETNDRSEDRSVPSTSTDPDAIVPAFGISNHVQPSPDPEHMAIAMAPTHSYTLTTF